MFTGGKSSSPGLSLTTIVATVALFGVHMSDPSFKAFSEIALTSDGLEEWLEITGAKVTRNWERRQQIIRYTLPKPQSYKINKTLRLSIEFTASVPFAGNVRETKIVQSATIKLKPREALSLDDVFILLHRINTFLCLAYDQPTALRSVSLLPPKSTEPNAEEGGRREVELFYNSLPHPERPPTIGPFNVLLPFNVIKKRLDKVVSQWLTLYDDLEPAIESVFLGQYSKASVP